MAEDREPEARSGPSQFEQENDFGAGGGTVDEETLDEAWGERERRSGDHRAPSDTDRKPAGATDEAEPDHQARNPIAKTSSGDTDAP